ncbi:MAG: hypothetical protein H0X31_13895 [Nostocaceae cyanobacterium]|nr:hypothetical protein [Nostocaceae cyanobacterium]
MKKRFDANKRKEKGERLSVSEIPDVPPEQQPPLFSLCYMNKDYSISKCTKDEKAALADTLYQLSQLTWSQIKASPRHGLGYEKIDRNVIKSSIPSQIKNDVNLIAFRFCALAPMVGYRDGAVFHIIWLDRDFTLYPHS